MSRLVQTVKDPDSPWYSPSTRIILVTPPPVNTYQRGADLLSRDPPKLLDRLFDTTRKYAEAVVGVGEMQGVPVADIWNAIYDASGRDEQALSRFLWDGLHLNAAGYDVRSKFVAQILELDESILFETDYVPRPPQHHQREIPRTPL